MKTRLLTSIAVLAGLTAGAQNTGIGTITPTDQLHTTGTVRFQNYSGGGNRLLYIDSTGRINTPVVAASFTNSINYSIPDNGCAAGTSFANSVIAVTGMPTAVPSGNISVRINITHTFDGDLTILLFAPNGNTLRLAGSNGGNGDNFTNTIFSDAAPASITAGTAPFNGAYQPAGGLLTFCTYPANKSTFASIGNGSIVPNGSWTIRVLDGAANDVGILNNWSISFDGPFAFGTSTATGPVPYYKSGSLVAGNITNAATGNVGIGNTAPAYNLDVTGTLHATGNTTLDGTVQIAGGTPAANDVLTATNSSGAATWQKPAAYNSAFNGQLLAAAPSVASGSSALIPFDAAGGVTFDDAAGFSGSPAFSYTVPATGVYQLNVQAITNPATAAATGSAFLIIKVNGASAGLLRDIQSATAGLALRTKWNINTLAKLNAGAVLTVEFSNATGTTITLPTVVDTQFSGVRLY